MFFKEDKRVGDMYGKESEMLIYNSSIFEEPGTAGNLGFQRTWQF